MKKILLNKFIISALIPSLLLFWFFFSVLFINRISFSVLTYQDSLNHFPKDKLTKNHKITGEFTARENYLGLIILNFKKYAKPEFSEEDVLLFRIKEKSSNKWYYSQKYRSGLIQNQNLLPIGFPVISDSKGGKYEFELVSLKGKENNAVEIAESTFNSGHQIPKAEVLKNKQYFGFTKIISDLRDPYFILSSSIFLFPLIVYILLLLLIKKNKLLKKYLTPVMSVLFLVDLFLINEFYIGIFLIILFIWLITIYVYKQEAKISLYMAFLLIFIWILLSYIGILRYTEKLNIYTYFLLLTGVFQLLIEVKKIQNKK